MIYCIISFEYYVNPSMQAIEMKLNMIFGKNPNLINSLERFHHLPLIRKYSQIPFIN